MDLAGRPPEVVEVMQWSANQSFVLSANFHTGALVVNYPYDNDGLRERRLAHARRRVVRVSGRDLRLAQPADVRTSPYFPGGITNGAAWYAIDGGMQDWNYRYLGDQRGDDRTVGYEVARALSLLPTLWNNNRESMLSYLEAVHMGVRGLVTDAATGAARLRRGRRGWKRPARSSPTPTSATSTACCCRGRTT